MTRHAVQSSQRSALQAGLAETHAEVRAFMGGATSVWVESHDLTTLSPVLRPGGRVSFFDHPRGCGKTREMAFPPRTWS